MTLGNILGQGHILGLKPYMIQDICVMTRMSLHKRVNTDKQTPQPTANGDIFELKDCLSFT